MTVIKYKGRNNRHFFFLFLLKGHLFYLFDGWMDGWTDASFVNIPVAQSITFFLDIFNDLQWYKLRRHVNLSSYSSSSQDVFRSNDHYKLS